MSRRPRIVIPGIPLHIIQRGNNRNPCFFERNNYLVYLAMLLKAGANAGCSVHAYVLMTNHVHLLVSPQHENSPAEMMKLVGSSYVPYINRMHGRFGTLWQGRYRSCLVQDERYFLICQRYIELNPVRAGLVRNPLDYEWSSYRANAHGERSDIVKPHENYRSLSVDQEERERRYRALFDEALPERELEHLRYATRANGAFGNAQFSESITATTGYDLTPGKPGRKQQG